MPNHEDLSEQAAGDLEDFCEVVQRLAESVA
jgi:hypothetical protein